MNPATPNPATERILPAVEWGLTIILAAVVAWTTLCLGGYLSRTMVVSGPAILGLAALAAGLQAWRPVRFGAADWLPVPFLLFALASVLWLAPAKWLAWREWLLWLQMWLVFLLVRHRVRSRGQTSLLFGVMAALAVTGAAMAAYQRFVDPKWMMLGRTQAEQFSTRSAGMFGIPNSLAALIELVLPVCLVLLWRRGTGWGTRLFSGWLALLLLGALVLTGSRGGWIALSAVLLIRPFLGAGSWRGKLLGALGLGCLVAAGLLILYRLSPAARERIDPFLAGQFELSRPILWKAQLQIWRDHPWFGSGAASFNLLFEPLRPAGFLNDPRWAHNDYLNTLGDYGLIGFLLWAGAGAGLLVLGRRARKPLDAAEEGWLGREHIRLGLWLGLLAYALHLSVDFHTKIPALAYLAAISTGLLLRPPASSAKTGPATSATWIISLGAGAMLLWAAFLARPLYLAEAEREEARRAIDRQAETGQGDALKLAVEGATTFRHATGLNPGNAQAWADLSYAIALSWPARGVPISETGREALRAAEEAVRLCPEAAEYWVRRGVAADMIPDRRLADASFARVAVLAPRNREWLFYLAYHWATASGHKAEAQQAIDACLSLDPSYAQAIRLRERIHALPR
jgi:O-antigen ligase